MDGRLRWREALGGGVCLALCDLGRLARRDLLVRWLDAPLLFRLAPKSGANVRSKVSMQAQVPLKQRHARGSTHLGFFSFATASPSATLPSAPASASAPIFLARAFNLCLFSLLACCLASFFSLRASRSTSRLDRPSSAALRLSAALISALLSLAGSVAAAASFVSGAAAAALAFPEGLTDAVGAGTVLRRRASLSSWAERDSASRSRNSDENSSELTCATKRACRLRWSCERRSRSASVSGLANLPAERSLHAKASRATPAMGSA